VIFGCNQFEEIDSSLEEQVFKVSEENGFRSEKIPLNQIPTEKGIHLKLNELPEFLKYLKKGRSDKAAFIDGTAFLNYDTVNLRVRIDGCSGEVSYHEVNE
jgi:hypothetical protein